MLRRILYLDFLCIFQRLSFTAVFHVELFYLGIEHKRTNYSKLFDRKQRLSCFLYVTLNALATAHCMT